jgi:hypothetical protein
MYKVKETIVVEGIYDKIKLSEIVDSLIFVTDGFSVFNNKKAQKSLVTLAEKTGLDINKIKTAYDCTSTVLGIGMSFAFFGFGVFEGVKLGTVICAMVNGFLIGRFTKLLEKHFVFENRFGLEKYFR